MNPLGPDRVHAIPHLPAEEIKIESDLLKQLEGITLSYDENQSEISETPLEILSDILREESQKLTESSSHSSQSTEIRDPYAFSDMDFGPDYVKITLTQKQEKALSQSQDIGGHGQTLKGKLSIHGSEVPVFLKPFDGPEVNNYRLLGRFAGKVAEFLPKVHGLATDSHGKQFLILEDILASPEEPSENTPLFDIKIAGKAEGIDNPICDLDEVEFTKRKKGTLDYQQMRFGANQSPGFMVCQDHSVFGKYGRALNYGKSKQNLKGILQKNGQNPQKLEILIEDLDNFKKALEESNIALIGGSLFFFTDPKGQIRFKLIDPAHVQYNPEFNDTFEEEGGYCGTKESFAARKASNLQGIAALRQAIVDHMAEEELRSSS